MKRSEFGKLLNLSQDYIAEGRENRPGTANTKEFITIHNTDNADAGANAKAHAKFLKETGYYIHNGKRIDVSWHYTVDDKQIVKHLPIEELGYHAKSGNARSIGIEICMNAGIDQKAAFVRASRLVAALLFDMKKTTKSVVPHHKWTGKNCPSLLLEAGKPGKKWTDFLAKISEQLATIE